jgi:hypothetical protein
MGSLLSPKFAKMFVNNTYSGSYDQKESNRLWAHYKNIDPECDHIYKRVNNLTINRSVRSLHYLHACQRLGLIFNRGLKSYQLIASAQEDFAIEEKHIIEFFKINCFSLLQKT